MFITIAVIAIVGATTATAKAQNYGVPTPSGNYEHCVPNGGAVGTFNKGYLAHHPEVAEQLRQNPELADNPQFVASHPGLDKYLERHPHVRQRLRQHPGHFMKAERRYERHENKPCPPGIIPAAGQ
jgi:hypothetical protein